MKMKYFKRLMHLIGTYNAKMGGQKAYTSYYTSNIISAMILWDLSE